MSAEAARPPVTERLRPGLRAGMALGAVAFLVGLSFGVLARPEMGKVAPIVMSAVVFAGAAQFGALAVLASGGGAVPAVLAGVLLNARFLPMGLALGPSLPGRALRRAVEGQAVVDASWALAARGDGTFDRDLLLGATLPQYPMWIIGTAVGDSGRGAPGGPRRARPRRALPGVLPRSPDPGAEGPEGSGRGAGRSGAGARAHAGRPRRSARAGGVPGRPMGAEAMSTVWITIASLAVATVLIKAAGPVAVGGRQLSPPALRVITLLAPTVLAALVAVETFGSGKHDLVMDARVVGLLTGGAAIALRLPLAVMVLAAAGAAAGARALGAA